MGEVQFLLFNILSLAGSLAILVILNVHEEYLRICEVFVMALP